MRRGVVLAAALALTACSPSPDEAARSLPRRLAFEPDPRVESASLSLEAGEASGSTLSLELVAREIDDVYALVFRLKYEPGALRFSRLDSGSVFTNEPDLVVEAKQARPGLLLGVVTTKGARAGVSGLDTTLAVVTFEVVGVKSSVINFDAARTRVLASNGERVALRVVGGSLVVD